MTVVGPDTSTPAGNLAKKQFLVALDLDSISNLVLVLVLVQRDKDDYFDRLRRDE